MLPVLNFLEFIEIVPNKFWFKRGDFGRPPKQFWLYFWLNIVTLLSSGSALTITFDFFQVIVYPTRENLQLFGAALILLIIWLIAVMLAMPLFIYRHLLHHDMPGMDEAIPSLDFCIENWPIEHGRAYYSIFSLIFQYTLPIIIVSVSI